MNCRNRGSVSDLQVSDHSELWYRFEVSGKMCALLQQNEWGSVFGMFPELFCCPSKASIEESYKYHAFGCASCRLVSRQQRSTDYLPGRYGMVGMCCRTIALNLVGAPALDSCASRVGIIRRESARGESAGPFLGQKYKAHNGGGTSLLLYGLGSEPRFTIEGIDEGSARMMNEMEQQKKTKPKHCWRVHPN